MLSLSSSIVFSWLGLVAFLLRSPILLFAVAQIIKWNYCVCTNPMFFSFLSQSSWRKTRKLRKRFERMQRVRKKEKARNELNCIFFFIVSIVYLFSEKSDFCGFHEPLLPEEQHPVPWRKGWREEKTPSYQNEADVRRQWERDGILKSKEEASWWGNKYCRGG